MAGGENSAEVAQLKGLGKYFNSITVTGRANVAKMTYAVCAGIGIMIWATRPAKPKPIDEGPKTPLTSSCGCN